MTISTVSPGAAPAPTGKAGTTSPAAASEGAGFGAFMAQHLAAQTHHGLGDVLQQLLLPGASAGLEGSEAEQDGEASEEPPGDGEVAAEAPATAAVFLPQPLIVGTTLTVAVGTTQAQQAHDQPGGAMPGQATGVLAAGAAAAGAEAATAEGETTPVTGAPSSPAATGALVDSGTGTSTGMGTGIGTGTGTGAGTGVPIPAGMKATEQAGATAAATGDQPATAAVGATAPATAPAAPAAAPAPAGGNPVTSQVFPTIPALVSRGEGMHSMTLRLHPADLGEVHVTVTVKNGAVDVTIAAGREAQEALRTGSGELRSLLDLAGAATGQLVVRDLPGSAAAQPSASAGAFSLPSSDADTHGATSGSSDEGASQDRSSGRTGREGADAEQAPSQSPSSPTTRATTRLDLTL
jgi:flagellar hook-length control protein FliK